MATVTLFSPCDLFVDEQWSWSVRNTSATSITIGDGVHQETLSGNFTFPTSGGFAGTVNAASYFVNNVEVLHVEGVSADASFLNFIVNQANYLQSVVGFMLSQDDTIIGSAGNDGLIGFGGNDKIYGGAGNDSITGATGNDFIDGGEGLDTVYYYGDKEPIVVRNGDGSFKVTDQGIDGVDTLVNVERLVFENGKAFALDVDAGATAGEAYRLYQAAFNRTPDSAGVGYWIHVMDQGASLVSVAEAFTNSKEYQDAYGTGLSSQDLVTRYYENILHRAPEQAGLDYWTGLLDHKALSVAQVLASISESQENIDGTAPVIGNGFEYTPWSWPSA